MRKKQKLQLVNFKADPTLVEWIHDFARRNDTYVSEVIRHALEKLQEEDKRKKPRTESRIKRRRNDGNAVD